MFREPVHISFTFSARLELIGLSFEAFKPVNGTLVTHYHRFGSDTLEEDGFLGCGQSLVCELKSQLHEHLAYAERLKLHKGFLSFGPVEAAACGPALGVQRFHVGFCCGLLKST